MDTYFLRHEIVVGNPNIATTLHDMIGDIATVRFPHRIEVCHWAFHKKGLALYVLGFRLPLSLREDIEEGINL